MRFKFSNFGFISSIVSKTLSRLLLPVLFFPTAFLNDGKQNVTDSIFCRCTFRASSPILLMLLLEASSSRSKIRDEAFQVKQFQCLKGRGLKDLLTFTVLHCSLFLCCLNMANSLPEEKGGKASGWEFACRCGWVTDLESVVCIFRDFFKSFISSISHRGEVSGKF